jgi:hypothetical protein
MNGRVYHGAESKFGITYNGKDYIVKMPYKGWKNVFSEHVGSRFINACGIVAHNTELATYHNETCVICEDFTGKLGELREFDSISSSFDTDKRAHDYFFSDVIYMLSKLRNINVEETTSAFMRMFLMDAILGNSDRHMGNWGLCKRNDKYKFAPVYDNAASLFPRANIEDISEEWMRERCYTFPNSKVMFGDERKRSNYIEVVRSGIIPKYILDFVVDIDKATVGLENKYRDFYRTIVWYRFNVIIKGDDFKWRGIIR